MTPDKYKIYSIRGFKMYLNPHESFMMKMRLLRIYERDKFNFIKNNLKRNDIFIDVGANIGDFSLYAAKLAREGKVLSFEPSSDNFKMLKKSIKVNNYNNIFPHQVAIGLNDDKIKLTFSHIGYQTIEKEISLPQKDSLIIKMKETFFSMDELDKNNDVGKNTKDANKL